MPALFYVFNLIIDTYKQPYQEPQVDVFHFL